MFQYKFHNCVSSVAECLVRIRQEKLLHHCIIKLKASLLLVSTYTQHMASSTKHNLTATTCITIKTLEKSFERKKQKWISTNVVHRASCLFSGIQKKAVCLPKRLLTFSLQISSTDDTKSNVKCAIVPPLNVMTADSGCFFYPSPHKYETTMGHVALYTFNTQKNSNPPWTHFVFFCF